MSRRRLAIGAGILCLTVLATAAGWWGARATLRAPRSPLGVSPAATFQVPEGTVGRTQNVFVNASWSLTDAARNVLAGIVTSVEHPGGEARPGQVLYRVNLQPVVAATGDVPAFRDITEGSVGPDVAQLQRLLASLGLYRDRADGTFDAGVTAAVKKWQRQLGAGETGAVGIGTLLFLPRLPARLVPGPEVKVGKALRGDEVAVQQVADTPSVVVPLLAEQQRFAVNGAEVVVEARGSEVQWRGQVASSARGVNGGFDLQITGPEGSPVCGDRCDLIPVGETAVLPGQIVLVAPRRGPVVPVAAVLTSPDGKAHVMMADGSERPVTILAASDGLAVVDGVSVDEIVRIGAGGRAAT